MKTIRSLICAGVLLAAGNCLAFAPGNQVQVIDVSSPYYLHVGVVKKVRNANQPNEIDGVLIDGVRVRFFASELKLFSRTPPTK